MPDSAQVWLESESMISKFVDFVFCESFCCSFDTEHFLLMCLFVSLFLLLFHSKISSVYRNARRKHREQIWRVEKQMASLSERHMSQITELQATLENLEDRREETVLWESEQRKKKEKEFWRGSLPLTRC